MIHPSDPSEQLADVNLAFIEIGWNWDIAAVCVCVDRCLNFHMLWPEEKIELERALQKQRFEQWVVRHVSAWSVSCEVITPQPIACAKRWHCKTGNTEKCACMQMRRCRRLHCKESETDRQTDRLTDWQTDRLTDRLTDWLTDWQREREREREETRSRSPLLTTRHAPLLRLLTSSPPVMLHTLRSRCFKHVLWGRKLMA